MSTDTEPVALPSGVAARFVGKRMPRTEDQRMITGHGRYIDDLSRRGTAHVAFVRSSVAAGRITSIDATEARQMPGVIAVLTAAEINPLVNVVNGPGDPTPRNVLADGTVRFVGDPIAMVLAESRYLAEDAAELVVVDIEPGEAVVTAEQALAEGSPRVHAELTDNAAGVLPAADNAELDAIIENAPHVFTETFAQHRYVNVPMETRGLIAEWDVGAKKLEVVLACQGVHDVRAFYARMLGLPADDIRVTMGDVGGSFGQKAFPTRDEQAVVAAAMIVGDRPIKWIEDRAENLISAGHARQESLRITAATDERGVLLAAKAHHTENVGAYPTGQQRPDGGPVIAGLPRAVSLVRARFGGLLRAGGLHEHVRAVRVPGAMDDGDHRPGADGRRHRAPAGHRPAGIPPPQRAVPFRAALHQPDDPGLRRRQPGRVPGAGDHADRLRAVPQGPGSGPRRGSPARRRAVPVHRAPAVGRQRRNGCGHDPDRAQRQGQRVHGDRQPRAGHRDDHDPDRGRRDGRQYRGRALRPRRHGLDPLRLPHWRQPDGRGVGRGRAPGRRGHEGARAGRGRADDGNRPGRPGDDRERGPDQGRPRGQERDAGRDRRGRLHVQPGRAAARVRGRPGDFQAVSGTDLDVLQRLPRGHGRDRPGDRDGARSCATSSPRTAAR